MIWSAKVALARPLIETISIAMRASDVRCAAAIPRAERHGFGSLSVRRLIKNVIIAAPSNLPWRSIAKIRPVFSIRSREAGERNRAVFTA